MPDNSSRKSKRPAEEPHTEEPPPKKIHPFFSKDLAKANETFGPFKWLPPLGKKKTCLHGLNLQPELHCKIAAFDLDGTVIKFANYDNSEWQWWNSIVPTRLREVARQGYTIVFFSNQAVKPLALKKWKEKVISIASALDDVPFRLYAATAKDGYRKPMLGMWWEMEKVFKEENCEIDFTHSFFVGDAAGRQFKGRKPDFASTDRKFALNIGIPFRTPEEYFLNLPTHSSYQLSGFNVSSLPELPPVTPTSSPIVPSPAKQEIVVFCGYPALGKTRFYRQHFEPLHYVHVNQDTLKTREKCVKATREALGRGQSCVIDNSNRDAKTRKYYVDAAKEFKVPVRCFIFTGSEELAWHNNLYRAFHLPSSVAAQGASRELVPYGAFTNFRDQYEEPVMHEGFTEIRKVNFKFEGTDEESKNWAMWLQIDGT